MYKAAVAAFLLLLATGLRAEEAPGCASTIEELRILAGDARFPLRWEEISMDDGKPLVVSIRERNRMLQLEFVKTGESLWAESSGVICRNGNTLEARLTKEQIRLGAACNWLLRIALANGGMFTLRRKSSGPLQIATRGWSGSFVPAPQDGADPASALIR